MSADESGPRAAQSSSRESTEREEIARELFEAGEALACAEAAVVRETQRADSLARQLERAREWSAADYRRIQRAHDATFAATVCAILFGLAFVVTVLRGAR